MENNKKKHVHMFDIDAAAWVPGAMWWVVDKEQPDKYVIRLAPDEGALVVSGFHKKQQLHVQYNGKDGWLSGNIYDRIQRKRKMPLVRIGISDREFLDGDAGDDLARAAGIAAALTAAGLDPAADHEVVLLTAHADDGHGVLLQELKKRLSPLPGDFGVRLRVQTCAGSTRSKKGATNAIMHVYEALERVVGLRVEADAFSAVDAGPCDLVRFYTEDTEQLEALFAANMLLRRLYGSSDDAIKQELRAKLSDDAKVLRVMQLATNRANPFRISDVEVYC